MEVGGAATGITSHLEAWGGVQGGATASTNAYVLTLRDPGDPAAIDGIPRVPRLESSGIGGLEARGQPAPFPALEVLQTQFLGLWGS